MEGGGGRLGAGRGDGSGGGQWRVLCPCLRGKAVGARGIVCAVFVDSGAGGRAVVRHAKVLRVWRRGNLVRCVKGFGASRCGDGWCVISWVGGRMSVKRWREGSR